MSGLDPEDLEHLRELDELIHASETSEELRTERRALVDFASTLAVENSVTYKSLAFRQAHGMANWLLDLYTARFTPRRQRSVPLNVAYLPGETSIRHNFAIKTLPLLASETIPAGEKNISLQVGTQFTVHARRGYVYGGKILGFHRWPRQVTRLDVSRLTFNPDARDIQPVYSRTHILPLLNAEVTTPFSKLTPEHLAKDLPTDPDDKLYLELFRDIALGRMELGEPERKVMAV